MRLGWRRESRVTPPGPGRARSKRRRSGSSTDLPTSLPAVRARDHQQGHESEKGAPSVQYEGNGLPSAGKEGQGGSVGMGHATFLLQAEASLGLEAGNHPLAQ